MNQSRRDCATVGGDRAASARGDDKKWVNFLNGRGRRHGGEEARCQGTFSGRRKGMDWGVRRRVICMCIAKRWMTYIHEKEHRCAQRNLTICRNSSENGSNLKAHHSSLRSPSLPLVLSAFSSLFFSLLFFHQESREGLITPLASTLPFYSYR